jgi:hypothetical protein
MKTVLISPLGASKGLLYTALQLTKPMLVVVLTSKEFSVSAEEILEKTAHKEKQILTMKDVFTGFNEADSLVSEVKALCCSSDLITINLTGGTTAMQWIMQAIYETLNSENFRVKRVAFIDRRDSFEQKKNPYVIGELYEIDK